MFFFFPLVFPHSPFSFFFFFFNDTATTEIYTLSLHDALPIFPSARGRPGGHHAPGAAGRRTGGAVHPVARVAPVSTGERASRGRGPRRRHRPSGAGRVDGGTFLRRPGQRLVVVFAGGRTLRGAACPRGRRAYVPGARRVRARGGAAPPPGAPGPRGATPPPRGAPAPPPPPPP